MMQAPIDRIVQMIHDRFREPAKSIEEVREKFQQLADDLPPAECEAEYVPVDAGGVPSEWVTTGHVSENVVLFLHGGGYNCGSNRVYRQFNARLADACRARVLAVDYRLAPEHKFPAPVEDAVAAYHWLIRDVPPEQVTICGDSAGGGLTLATLLALRDSGAPLPRAAVCVSPWTDLEATGESMRTKTDVDPWIRPERVPLSTRLYVTETDLRNPLAAPLHANPTGLPPLLILVGSDETLLDDSTRFAAKAEDAGVDVTLEVWDGMIHVWPFFAGILPEGTEAFERIGVFINEYKANS